MYRAWSWYAVRVRVRREFSVASLLKDKGYEVFLPHYCTAARRSSPRRPRSVALFPGYLFCRIEPDVSGSVLRTPNVMAFVCCGRTPIEVDSEEIRMLQLAVAQRTVHPSPFVRVGQRVRVTRGPLSGLEGIVMRIRSEMRLVLSISMLHRSAAVELDGDAITPLPSDGPSVRSGLSSRDSGKLETAGRL